MSIAQAIKENVFAHSNTFYTTAVSGMKTVAGFAPGLDNVQSEQSVCG